MINMNPDLHVFELFLKFVTESELNGDGLSITISTWKSRGLFKISSTAKLQLHARVFHVLL